MMLSKESRYICFVVLIVFFAIACNMLAVVIVDPHKVFGWFNLNQRNFEPNTRFLKAAYLRDHLEFDAFVMGSSRANAYDVSTAAALAGGQFYNFTVAGDTPLGMLRKVEWLSQSRRVTRLVITFSFDDFIYTNAQQDSLMHIEHPMISHIGGCSFWKPYLIGPFAHPLSIAQTLYGNFVKPETWYVFDLRTGQYDFPLFRQQMNENSGAYIAHRFSTPAMIEKFAERDSVDSFAALVSFVRSAGIETTFVINPDNRRTFRSFRPDAYWIWLGEIVRITGGVWDFSGINSVTSSDQDYFEQRHFSEAIGNQVLTRVYRPGKEKVTAHGDFGKWVTMGNLPQRLDELSQDWTAQGGRIALLARQINKEPRND